MNDISGVPRGLVTTATAGLLLASGANVVTATEPCGSFGECKVIVEINSTDGDIGFHWLADGDDLLRTTIRDPDWRAVYTNRARGPLREQTLTETFGESAEPFCRESLKEDEDDRVVTLEEFRELWRDGPYYFIGLDSEREFLFGTTELTYFLPAAPENLTVAGGIVSWAPGSTLGECASEAELTELVSEGVLPIHPMHVPLESWEVVLELEDGSNRKFSVQLPPAQTSVTLPAEFISSLPPNTPAKAEVGAIGGDLSIGDNDNATFTELGDLCLNEQDDGCVED
ncbi:MAG: hypothetical protein HKN84_11205 [Gammaproteobacteria bacterium]|nr:hypothetical protein [Gammaproteobacteria bacterium]